MTIGDAAAGRDFVLRVLIVEDNDAAAKTTGWMVELMGHAYQLANSAEQAMTAAADFAPHVLMIDLGLPRTNGYEACRQLRALPGLDKVVAIAQTGWSGDDYRQRALEAGFQHYMVKPLAFEELSTLLETIKAEQSDG